MIWHPQKGGTVDEHWCAKVVADFGPWKAWVGREYSEAILTELFDGIYRYPGTNNGALRQAGNIYQRGFKSFRPMCGADTMRTAAIRTAGSGMYMSPSPRQQTGNCPPVCVPWGRRQRG